MKRLLPIVLFCVLGFSGKSFALPPCPASGFGIVVLAPLHGPVETGKDTSTSGNGRRTSNGKESYILLLDKCLEHTKMAIGVKVANLNQRLRPRVHQLPHPVLHPQVQVRRLVGGVSEIINLMT